MGNRRREVGDMNIGAAGTTPQQQACAAGRLLIVMVVLGAGLLAGSAAAAEGTAATGRELAAAAPIVVPAAAPSAVSAAVPIVVAAAVPTAVPATTLDDLEQQKLEEEIRQLRLANEQASGWFAGLLPLAPFLTVLIAVFTLAGALWKQSSDVVSARMASEAETKRWREEFTEQQLLEATKAQQWREEFTRQQELDRDEAEQEHLGRFDEALSRISTQISSDNPGLSLNGAAALGVFAKERYQDLHVDLLRIVVANLKSAPPDDVSDLLRGHLSRVLQMLFAPGRTLNGDLPVPIDLTELNLNRLDLRGLHLPPSGALDLAFANLSETRMPRVRGYKAQLNGTRFSRAVLTEARFNRAHAEKKAAIFHQSTLVSATFDDAALPGAEFQRASLQGGKFRRCVLTGAQFEGADVADAYFQDAQFDDAALRSIALGARNWQGNTHFDADVMQRMLQIAAADAGA